VRYTTEPELTVRALWQEEYRDDVTLKVFREWAETDEWERHRKEFWDAASRRVLHRVMDDVVQAEAKEVVDLQQVVHGMIERLKPIGYDKDGIPVFRDQVSSVDKLAQALTKLEERLSRKRRGAVDMARDMSSVSAPDPGTTPVQAIDISDDDVAALAAQVLRGRMLGEENDNVSDTNTDSPVSDPVDGTVGTTIELPDEDGGERDTVQRPGDDRDSEGNGVGDTQIVSRPPPVE